MSEDTLNFMIGLCFLVGVVLWWVLLPAAAIAWFMGWIG